VKTILKTFKLFSFVYNLLTNKKRPDTFVSNLFIQLGFVELY